jgi:hypothetical protein
MQRAPWRPCVRLTRCSKLASWCPRHTFRSLPSRRPSWRCPNGWKSAHQRRRPQGPGRCVPVFGRRAGQHAWPRSGAASAASLHASGHWRRCACRAHSRCMQRVLMWRRRRPARAHAPVRKQAARLAEEGPVVQAAQVLAIQIAGRHRAVGGGAALPGAPGTQGSRSMSHWRSAQPRWWHPMTAAAMQPALSTTAPPLPAARMQQTVTRTMRTTMRMTMLRWRRMRRMRPHRMSRRRRRRRTRCWW